MDRLLRIGSKQSSRKSVHCNGFCRSQSSGRRLLVTEKSTSSGRQVSSLRNSRQQLQLLSPIYNNPLLSCRYSAAYFGTKASEDCPVETNEAESSYLDIRGNLDADFLATLRKETNQYLDENNLPVGSMNVEDLEKALQTLWSWTKVRSIESVEHSIALLERLVNEQNTNFNAEVSDLQFSQSLNYSLLNALVKNWHLCWKDTTGTAKEDVLITPRNLWDKIEDWSERSAFLKPQISTIGTILRAIVFRIKSLEEAEYVESVVDDMEEGNRTGKYSLPPSIVEYNMLMNAFAKVMQPERSEAILMRIVSEYENGASNLIPDKVSFVNVLHAWKHARTSDAGERSEAILDFMIDFGIRVGDSSIANPDFSSYYAVLYAFCGNRTNESIHQAERVLQRMQEDYQNGNEEARPTDTCYGLIIHSWSQLGCAEESERMLRQMYDDHTKQGNEQAQVTRLHFNSAISSWTRSGAPYALDRALELFRSMERLNIKPDKSTYGALLHCTSRSKNPDIGKIADKLLQEQQERYRAGDEDFRPDVLNYNAAMHCWSSLGNAERTEELLKELLEEHKRGNLQITDERPFNTAIAAWSRSRNPGRAERAESIFQEMTRLKDNGELAFQPNANTISALQGCWASAEQNISGEKCLALLREMQKLADAGDSTMEPKESNYKVVIDAFNRIRRPEQAEDLWYEMLKEYVEGKIDAKPGTDTCKAILTSWLQSGAPDAVERTLAMMERIAEIERSQILELNLDIHSYRLMLDICSKSSVPEIKAGAESIVRKMEELHEVGTSCPLPDSRCYNVAIHCWGKLGQAERAEGLFWEMYKGGKSHTMSDSYTISTVLSAWARSKSDAAPRRAEVFFERIKKIITSGVVDDEKFKLDVVCHAALLSCLANARTDEAAERAYIHFQSMKQAAAAGQNDLLPSEKCYYTVLKALQRVGKAEHAEGVLREMADLYTQGRKDLQLTNRSFGLVLSAWLDSNSEDAPVRADYLLRWMVQQHGRGAAAESPDALSFSSVLRCWSRSRRPESGKHAEVLFHEMARRFGRDNKEVQACTSDLVRAWARSGTVDKAEKLLLRLGSDFLKQPQRHNKVDSTQQRKRNPSRSFPPPDVRAFIAVLAALKSQSPKDGSIGMRVLRLIELMREIDSYTNPKVNAVLDHWNSLSQDSKSGRLQAFLSRMEDLDAPASDSSSNRGEQYYVDNDDNYNDHHHHGASTVNLALKF